MTNSADLKKPTDLGLHCLLRQGMLCSAREGLMKLEMCDGGGGVVINILFLHENMLLMSTHNMFLWRNQKDICTFCLEKKCLIWRFESINTWLSAQSYKTIYITYYIIWHDTYNKTFKEF